MLIHILKFLIFLTIFKFSIISYFATLCIHFRLNFVEFSIEHRRFCVGGGIYVLFNVFEISLLSSQELLQKFHLEFRHHMRKFFALLVKFFLVSALEKRKERKENFYQVICRIAIYVISLQSHKLNI